MTIDKIKYKNLNPKNLKLKLLIISVRCVALRVVFWDIRIILIFSVMDLGVHDDNCLSK